MKMLAASVLALLSVSTALAAKPASSHTGTLPKVVAYDAKDNKYYSVAYAKSHAMHDRGGDLLVLIPSAKLPPTAKMSHAMHGKM